MEGEGREEKKGKGKDGREGGKGGEEKDGRGKGNRPHIFCFLNLGSYIQPHARSTVKVKAAYSSLLEPISELRGVTCHMESHNVTCHTQHK